MRVPSDLGETMVVAHAAVVAEAGEDIIVLIDDSGGRHLANKETELLALPAWQ